MLKNLKHYKCTRNLNKATVEEARRLVIRIKYVVIKIEDAIQDIQKANSVIFK